MRKSRRVLATGAGLALVAAGTASMFAPRSAQADAEPFTLSQYVSSTSTTVCNTDPVIRPITVPSCWTFRSLRFWQATRQKSALRLHRGSPRHDSGSNDNADIALTMSVPEAFTLGTLARIYLVTARLHVVLPQR